MEQDTTVRLQELEAKIDAVYASVEKTRKIMLWTGIITVAVIVVPLMLLPLFIPAFLQSQGVSSLSGIGAGGL